MAHDPQHQGHYLWSIPVSTFFSIGFGCTIAIGMTWLPIINKGDSLAETNMYAVAAVFIALGICIQLGMYFGIIGPKIQSETMPQQSILSIEQVFHEFKRQETVQVDQIIFDPSNNTKRMMKNEQNVDNKMQLKVKLSIKKLWNHRKHQENLVVPLSFMHKNTESVKSNFEGSLISPARPESMIEAISEMPVESSLSCTTATTLDNTHQKVRDYKAVFTKFCAFLFGTGSFIYFALQMDTQLSDELFCENNIQAVGDTLIIVFITVQAALFLDPLKRMEQLLTALRKSRSWHVIAVRCVFGMFLVANLFLWIYSVSTETIFDLCSQASKLPGGRTFLLSACNTTLLCPNPNGAIKMYLIPLVAEFGLLMCQVLIKWSHRTNAHKPLHDPQPATYSALQQGKYGLIVGIVILVIQVCSVAIFMIRRDRLHGEIVDALLHVTGILVSLVMAVKLHMSNLKIRNDPVSFEETLQLTFLLMTFFGTLLYFYTDAVDLIRSVEISSSVAPFLVDVLAPIDGTLQLIMIYLVAFTNSVNVKQEWTIISLMMYLFCQSLALWLAASYRLVHGLRWITEGEALQFNNILRRTCITHITVPLITYFRFQLAETWNHLYI